ncbi:hypothetical protein Glove_277g14 [Diversispora epigaea]|uniref:Uncharacterized protein n=1 Tax=Diversispora epigaea TaxID=1348612 RepID=A0A397I7V9_9GLOM|nr:hypothetical protein Glove_277g14 [Diversispora epigaea]
MDKALTPEYLDWYAKLVELPSSLTDKIRLILYRAYTEETGLDPWINSESPQIEKTNNHLSQNCVIKISKFPEEKSIIHEAVHKRFPFLSYTNSNAWHRDVFKYTDSEAKCPICKEVHTRYCIWGDWSCLDKDDHYYLNCSFRIDQKKVIIAVQTLTPEYLDWYAKLVELPSSLTDKIRLILYRAYTEETGLDPWINSESPQIEKTNNHLSQNCVIKISKFPEEKSIIHEAVHKRFPFLSYTNSNAWHRDVFKYTDSEAKCPICKEVHTRYCIWGDWSCLDKDDHYYLNCSFRIDQKKVIIAVQSLSNKTQSPIPRTNPNKIYQYAIEHKIDPEKFSVITEAEKNKWAMGCFPADLERDIRLYHGGIKRNEDTRKYYKFLTDRERLVGEELLRHGILKSGLSTTWLDDLMKEWEGIHTQFTQIFSSDGITTKA